MSKKSLVIISICVIAAILACAIGGVVAYVLDYYKADETALEMLNSNDAVTVSYNESKQYYAFEPTSEYTSAFVFIPGGKVEATAYAPLMQEIAKEGVLCILLEVKWRFAVLDQDAPQGIQDDFKNVSKWTLGGHSLGGAMASVYVYKNPNEYQGLVLLGAYANNDISNTDLKCIAIVGSEDNVINRTKFENNKAYLPQSTKYITIEGGNHAQFGSYGKQKDDGEATISNKEQWALTTSYVLDIIA